jgi:hypothetical protein
MGINPIPTRISNSVGIVTPLLLLSLKLEQNIMSIGISCVCYTWSAFTRQKFQTSCIDVTWYVSNPRLEYLTLNWDYE